jgi:hypothetical protein
MRGDKMKVSSKGEYALRALILLGNNKGKVLGIQEISEKTLVAFVLERTTLEDLLSNRISKLEGEDFFVVKSASGSASDGKDS